MTDDDIDRAIREALERNWRGEFYPVDDYDRAIFLAGYRAGQKSQVTVRIPTDAMEQEFARHYDRGFRAGAEAMRERAAKACVECDETGTGVGPSLGSAIRALPVE